MSLTAPYPYVRSVPQKPAIRPITVIALGSFCALLALFAVYVSAPIGGAIYAVLFMALTWIRPDLAFFLMFAAAPCVYDLGGGPVNMALADISLMLAFPILLVRRMLRHPSLVVNPIRIPVWVYLIVCMISVTANQVFASSFVSMVQMLVYLVIAVFVFSSCITAPEQLLTAYGGFIFTNLIFATAAVVMHAQYILGLHKNALGLEVGYGALVCADMWLGRILVHRPARKFALAMCLLHAGLITSLSRGSWLGTAAGLIAICFVRRRYRLLLKILVTVFPVVLLCWFALPAQSRDYAVDIGSGSNSTQARLQSINFAWRQFQSSPVIGIGVGLRKMFDSTNLIMSTMAETGVVGLIAFLGIFASIGYLVWKARQQLAPDDPAFAFLSIGAALVASSFVHGCVDHYWNRGLFPVWASVGLMVYAYNRSLQRLHNGVRP